MPNPIVDRTLAFAGICQCAKLVEELAHKGFCDPHYLEASLKSILVLNPSTTKDACGDESALKLGLDTFVHGLDDKQSSSTLMRYVISLITLEKKLRHNNQADEELTNRLRTAQYRYESQGGINSEVIKTLADIYLDVISPLGPRIEVTGDPAVLKQATNQHKIRSILLAGIRNTVLWQQVGGKRRHLILGRKSMVEQANILLARI